jgi:hypothetical protein
MLLAINPAPRPIASELRTQVEQIEKRSPGLRILAAGQFKYPVFQQELRIRVDTIRKLNLLEKYILRAATELSPPPSIAELAAMLEIDPVFFISVCDELSSRNHLEVSPEGIHITADGLTALQQQAVQEEPDYQTWYVVQDLLLGTTEFLRSSLEREANPAHAALPSLSALRAELYQTLTAFPPFEPAALSATEYRPLGLQAHEPESDRYVTEIVPSGTPQEWEKVIHLFVEHDPLRPAGEEVSLVVRAGGDPLPQVSTWLATFLDQHHLSLTALFPELATVSEEAALADETLPTTEDAEQVAAHLEHIEKQALEYMRLLRAGQIVPQTVGTARQLRDAEIRHEYLSALKEAHNLIIIYSPWVNEEAVDKDFLTLLEERVNKGVRILIGYGIGRSEQQEERPVPPALLQRLNAIRTLEDTPGVIADWLGNSHAKEIIIDHKIHLSGSHNWLSYRGDRFPRGETVYHVTIPAEVDKAYQHLAGRFQKRALSRWHGAGVRPHPEAMEDYECVLTTLAFLSKEELALNLLLKERVYTLLALWLTLAQQAVAAGKGARLRSAVQALDAQLPTLMHTPGQSWEEIATRTQTLIKRLA